jgi:GDP-4-dehydro-6-deoxy-D-mannose reductase
MRRLGDRAVRADVDILDADALREAVRAERFTAVAHLAATASVAQSWNLGADVWRVNAVGTVNVLDAVIAEAPGARVLVVSTAEIYGVADRIPTPEDSPAAPLSPYGASKVGAEVACGRARRAEGLDVVVARSFPHVGPGQEESFAVGSWVHQIALAELSGGGTLHVGDLSVRRDLVDVRDVARAYELLLAPAVPADTYNVASGHARELREVVELLVELARCTVEVEQDSNRLRSVDIPILCGDASRLAEATGWSPQIPLEHTLADALEEARHAVQAADAAKV